MRTLLEKAYREGEKYQRGLMRDHRRGRKHCFTVPQELGREVGYRAWISVRRRCRSHMNAGRCPAHILRVNWMFRRATHH